MKLISLRTRNQFTEDGSDAAGSPRGKLSLLLFILFAVLCLASSVSARSHHYTVAIVPQFPPSTIQADWMPLLSKVSEASGVELTLTFYRSIPEFEKNFLKGEPDFVYLNPYHAVIARRAQGYIPLLRDSEQKLIGILVVPKDSPVRNVRDLNGKKIVFPSPNAFAASLYMRTLLTEKEHVGFASQYVLTHGNVYRHVALADAEAGGGVNKTLSQEPPALQDMLRVIYKTPDIAPHPFCAHPRVPDSIRSAVASAVLKLAESDEGREVLKKVDMIRPVRADYRRDYGILEKLGLEKFFVKGGN